MSDYLIIIESPNKIASFRKYLGSAYEIVATKGHVVDLPPKSLGVDVKNAFKAEYVPIDGKGKILREIIEKAAGKKCVYLMTDPDREGSGIASAVARALPSGVLYKRATTHAITKDAILEAIKHASTIDENLVAAFEARRVTDRLVGYQVSPIMWRKGIRGTSAGRVQSVALKYVVDLEREIEAFVPEEYWELDADTKPGFKARLWGLKGESKTIRDEKTATTIKSVLEAGTKALKVVSVAKRTRTRHPEPPFTTASLQQAASTAMGWGVDKVMSVAQEIFSEGLITYHRTDSVDVDKIELAKMRDEVRAAHGVDHLAQTPNTYQSKKASQEAHEAIRPTGETDSSLAPDKRKLLDLIRNRYLASQMADAVFEQMTVELESVGTKTIFNFRVVGSRLLFQGFLKVYGSSIRDLILPDLTEGQEIGYRQILAAQKHTQPPSRYNDASLVKKMEADGVGRPATYAATIGVLRKREYVTKEGRSFKATDLGKLVCGYLETYFKDLVDPAFTAQMEDRLDDVASGTATYLSTLEAFYGPFSALLVAASKGSIKALVATDEECPSCHLGKLLKRRPRKGGHPFYGCERYPECEFTADADIDGSILRDGSGAPSKRVVEAGPKCPLCSKPTALRKGKYGEFYGCTGYPECKGILKEGKQSSSEPKVEIPTHIACPKCHKPMAEKRGKYGPFLGCTGYPDCQTIMGIPLGICRLDRGYIVERYSKKKRKSFYACNNYPDCDFASDSVDGFDPLPESK